jgi:hypothetical protein
MYSKLSPAMILSAADELTANGKSASSWSIRKILGTGSHETIGKYLQMYREKGRIPLANARAGKSHLCRTHIECSINLSEIKELPDFEIPDFGLYSIRGIDKVLFGTPMLIAKGKGITILPIYPAIKSYLNHISEPVFGNDPPDDKESIEAAGMRSLWVAVISQAFSDAVKPYMNTNTKRQARMFLKGDYPYPKMIFKLAGISKESISSLIKWYEDVESRGCISSVETITSHAIKNYSLMKFFQSRQSDNDDEQM